MNLIVVLLVITLSRRALVTLSWCYLDVRKLLRANKLHHCVLGEITAAPRASGPNRYVLRDITASPRGGEPHRGVLRDITKRPTQVHIIVVFFVISLQCRANVYLILVLIVILLNRYTKVYVIVVLFEMSLKRRMQST